jgi:hypothetical protein
VGETQVWTDGWWHVWAAIAGDLDSLGRAGTGRFGYGAISCRQQPGPSETLPVDTRRKPDAAARQSVVTPTPRLWPRQPHHDGAIVAPAARQPTHPSGDSHPSPSRRARAGSTPGDHQHTVIRGEWLYQIARCYGTAYSGVWAANRLLTPT